VLLTEFRTDAKTVSIAALASFHPNTKVQSAALHFFLGSDNDDEFDDSDDEEDTVRQARRNVKGAEHRAKINGGRKHASEVVKLQKVASKVS
jgi:protein SDA1